MTREVLGDEAETLARRTTVQMETRRARTLQYGTVLVPYRYQVQYQHCTR